MFNISESETDRINPPVTPLSTIHVNLPTTDTPRRASESRIINGLNNYIWRSCCGLIVDKRILLFISQFSISLLIIVFSMYQLHIDDSCERQQIYLNLITLMVGIFLPSPQVK